MTDVVVISGAAAAAVGSESPAPLLSVPESVDLAILGVGQDLRLVIQNPTAEPLTAALGESGDIVVAAGGSAVVPFRDLPDGARLDLQILPADHSRVATIVVTVELSDADPIVVGQAVSGPSGRVLSASKDLEPGVRAMLLLAGGLFRLDVLVVGDTLQTFVRNLTSGELELHGEVGQPRVATTTLGLAGRYAPGRADLRFAVGAEDARVFTEVTIATLRFAERGVIRVSAQGIVRRTG